jgi:hypothetical protein
LFENFREISLKRDLSNDTTVSPPLFSLVNTFKQGTYFVFYYYNLHYKQKKFPKCTYKGRRLKFFRGSGGELKRVGIAMLTSVLRIQDVYPGSDFFHPGSRIQG